MGKIWKLVGFKEKTKEMEMLIDGVKETWGITEDDLEDITPFVSNVVHDPDAPSVGMVNGVLTSLDKKRKQKRRKRRKREKLKNVDKIVQY